MSVKRVFLVTGSEDGPLAAASNLKAAYRIAVEYMEGEQDEKDILSYSKVCTLIRRGNGGVILGKGFAHTWIDVIEIHSK